MNLLAQSIKRPIAVAMIYLVIAALGINFLQKLPLQEVPTGQNLPSLNIRAGWPSTNPETMEAFVTSPLEGLVATIKGVKEVSSRTQEGYSLISAEFSEETDMKLAELELKEKISILYEELPEGVYYPTVSLSQPESRQLGLSTAEPLQYIITGNFTLEWIRKYAEDYISIPLQGIDGVSEVRLDGGKYRLIKLLVDQQKLDLFGVRESTINAVLRDANIDRPAGYIYKDGIRHDIFIDNQIKDVDELRKIMVRSYTGRMVYLTDIAEIIDGFEEPQSYFRINGNPVVNVTVEMEDGANVLEFTKAVDGIVEKVKQDFPETLQMIRTNDPSTRMQKDIANIQARAVFCILVIFLVLYVFLRNLKVPLLILSTIVFSELTTIILFYAFDLSFNILTIAGLALGFGMLVDSAIVVIDNIYRYREKGENAFDSAVKGSKEVFLPLLASVLTTSIVFIPFLYLDRNYRIVFTPVALAVALSLISSIAVAFTFIPTFAVKFLPKKNTELQDKIKKNKILQFMLGFYGRFIELVVRNKYATLVTVIMLFAGSVFVFSYTVQEFSFGGYGTQRTSIRVSVTLPEGTELDRGDEIAREFEDRVLGNENIRQVRTNVSQGTGGYYGNYLRLFVIIEFTEAAEETSYPYILYEELTAYASTFARVSITVQGMGDYFTAGGLGSTGVNFRIQVLGYNYNKVGEIAESLGRILERIPRVKNVNTNKSSSYRSSQKNETVIRINREALSSYDLTATDVLTVLSRYVRQSRYPGIMIVDGEEVRYAVKVEDFQDFQLVQLEDILFTDNSGRQVRMGDITEIGIQPVMSEIIRNNQQYEREVGFEYRGPAQIGERHVESIIETTVLPKGYKIQKSEGYRYFMTTRDKTKMWLSITFAVILVFMMTSSLYESVIHPFVVILTVPMAMIGVFLIFFFAGQNFSEAAYIGIILLAGIVVNNSIILVDHINLLRGRGMDLYTAVVQGCKDRVRPILMTSSTTILGLLPLIMFTERTRGYGENIWYAISLASIGGLLSATPLTLSVIPVLYILFEEWRNKLRKHWQASE
ncbi:efflux RND transporter permease subunit [candidate division KSB1 bacterium]